MKKYKYPFIAFLLVGNFLLAEKIQTIDFNDSIEVNLEESMEYVEENEEEEYQYEPRPTVFEQRNFDPNFLEKYQGKDFDYDKQPKVQKEFSSFNFNLPSGLLQVLMYILLGVVILLVLYHVFKNMGFDAFRGRKKYIKSNSSNEIDLENPENIQDFNFKQLIDQAKAQSDYRKAIRLYHLWILQKLTHKNLIIWNKNKTDHEYYLELKSIELQSLFSNSTYIYDYIWYGNFDLNANEFEQAETIFQNTLNHIK